MAEEYFKTKSSYVLAKKHQNTKLGTIWERDWFTTTQPSVGRFEVGERLWFGDSNFVFTTNYDSGRKLKYNTSNWVAHLQYNDVKDSKSTVNKVKPNYSSNFISDFAYYGSALNLMEKSIANIIKEFPGQMVVGEDIYYHNDTPTEFYSAYNAFEYNLLSSDFIEKEKPIYSNLRIVGDNYFKYVIIEDGVQYPIDNYIIKDSLEDINYSGTNTTTGTNTTEEYIKFRDGYYKWIPECNDYVLIDVVTNNDYFNSCNTLLQKGDKYYKWIDEKYCYEEVDIEEVCEPEEKLLYHIYMYSNYGTTNEKVWQFNVYSIEGQIYYASKTPNIVLRPNNETIEEYFYGLDNFERMLLRRDTNPLYTNKFIKFDESEDGNYVFSEKTLTFPSDNEYCIYVEGISFTEFVNDIMDLARHYDENWSDNLWRCMTHEAIKNFDWSYRREFTDDDTQDNIDGGLQMQKVLGILGYTYDNVKRYIDGIKFTNNITYNGYNNAPEAQFSDMANLKGVENYSTIWQPYEYVEITKEEMPQYNYGKSAFLPKNVTGNSPEYLQVGYITPTYYKRVTNNPADMVLTEDYIYGGNTTSEYISKIDPWIKKNHIGYAYQYVGTMMYFDNPCDAPLPGYWDNTNTFDDEPPVDVSETSPLYVRVRNGNHGYYYFVRVETFDNSKYLHDKWYGQLNMGYINPLEVDLEFQRRLFLSSKMIAKSKGTRESIEMMFALFGMECGKDYDIKEYYYTTTPKKLDEKFYFYEGLSEEPSGVIFDDTNTYTSIPQNPTAASQEYIRIDNNGEYTYYHLNGEYTVEEVIYEIRKDEFGYEIDDIYESLPITTILIENEAYVAPTYNPEKEYYGDLYYQSKGGWNKKTKTDDVYDYNETSGRLEVVENFTDLIYKNTSVEKNGYVYVKNPYDYLSYNEKLNEQVSNYFKLIDDENRRKPSAWRNIPMTGDIQYKNYVPTDENITHQDYLNIRHLEEIVTTDKGNNPHNGYGNYDGGIEFLQYMNTPFKYLIDGNYLHDKKIKEMAEQFVFSLEEQQEPKVRVLFRNYPL